MGNKIIIASVFFITMILNGCQEEMTPKAYEERKAGFIDTVVEEEETREFEKQPKQTESACIKQWKPLEEEPNPLLVLEERKISVTFTQETTRKEAIKVLKKYNVEEYEMVEIFPFVEEKRSEEEIFNNYKGIKGTVGKGKEITTACAILQEKSVETAAPDITFDLKKLAEAQQQ